MKRRGLAIFGIGALAAILAWVLFIGLPRWYGPRVVSPATPAAAASAAPAGAAAPGRKIKARLYYVSADGTRLTAVERDVAYGEGSVEQAREIIAAQIAPAAEPNVSAIPSGTSLRALFIDPKGNAYVDLTRPVSSAHAGGTLNELLTVYTIVDALTSNLPAVTAVQILVDGKTVATLAGHVDLRRPLAGDLGWVQ
jgi:spore germination protein GerM